MGTSSSLPAALRLNISYTNATAGKCSSEASQVLQDDADDLPELEVVPECAICYEMKDTLHLDCGHMFCADCVEGQLSARWSGSRMNFAYLNCGLCRSPMKHEELDAQLAAHHLLQTCMVKVALQKFRDDGFVEELAQQMGREVTDDEVTERAVADMAVFQCCDCREPYCAGRMDCATSALLEEQAEPTRCPDCEWKHLATSKDHRCMVHGHRFAMFKCDSCCSVATWNCYSHHYCERCHNQAGEAKRYPCPGPGACPLGMPHPANQEAVHGSGDCASFCIGCMACMGFREEQEVHSNEKNVFGFQQKDWLEFSDAAEVLKTFGDKEVRIQLKIMQPHLVEEHDVLSSQLCADKLLLLMVEQHRQSIEDARIRAEEAQREALEMEERWRLADLEAVEQQRRLAKAEAEAEKAKRIVWAQLDKEYLQSRSPEDFDWGVLREERRSKASFRSLARQVQLEAKSERGQKQHFRQKHINNRKCGQSQGERKARKVQAWRLDVELDANLTPDEAFP